MDIKHTPAANSVRAGSTLLHGGSDCIPLFGRKAEHAMKQWFLFPLLLVACLALTLTLADSSFAARMGGGKSFGSSPAMRAPTAAPRPMTQPSRQPYTAPSSSIPARPSSGMGAMGGLFGGLLAGTLLGSMLGHSGGAVAGGGGGGFGFIDLILFGVLAYFAYKLYRRFSASQQSQRDLSYEQSYGPQQSQYQDNSWDSYQGSGSGAAFGGPQVPPDFNVEEFLQGAKSAYVRMQSSWDKRDLDDIAQFATPAVMDVLREQMKEDPNPSRTEIININVQLMGVATDAGVQRAQVYFDVLMREDPNQIKPEPAREVWHFIRSLPDGTWKLDGIQQTY